MDEFVDDARLASAWQQMDLRLQAATDQHAAMTEELESLARSDPQRFTADQVWILIRAIKVQSQILQLYVGEPAMDI
jgi:urease accessory protein UreF